MCGPPHGTLPPNGTPHASSRCAAFGTLDASDSNEKRCRPGRASMWPHVSRSAARRAANQAGVPPKSAEVCHGISGPHVHRLRELTCGHWGSGLSDKLAFAPAEGHLLLGPTLHAPEPARVHIRLNTKGRTRRVKQAKARRRVPASQMSARSVWITQLRLPCRAGAWQAATRTRQGRTLGFEPCGR